MVVCKWEKVKKDLAQLLATSPPISPTPYCVIVESDFTDNIFDSVLLLFNGKKEKKKSLYSDNKPTDLPTPYCAILESDLMVQSVWKEEEELEQEEEKRKRREEWLQVSKLLMIIIISCKMIVKGKKAVNL